MCVSMNGGGAETEETERIPSRLCASAELDTGLEPTNHEIMT